MKSNFSVLYLFVVLAGWFASAPRVYAQETYPEPDLIDNKDIVGVYYYSAFQPNATTWELNADGTFEMIYYTKNTSKFAPSEYKRGKVKGTWICPDDTIIVKQPDSLPEKYLSFKGKLFRLYSETADGKSRDIPVSDKRIAEDSAWIRKKK